ncbi:MAG: signal recognition particle receptor subunit alpha, partial [Rhodobacteraceae bacterium]|nr:signal recognition particle receptor subunit alpha [Paracoccaceae bacterium]
MSFFRKLKDKLTRSSSKLEEGLDAIVEEGGAPDDAPAPAPSKEPQATPSPEPEQIPDPGPAPDTTPAPLPEDTAPHDPAQVPPLTSPELPPQPAPAPPRPADPAPKPAPIGIPEPEATPAAPDDTGDKPGLLGRLFGRGARSGQGPVTRRVLDDDMLEQLEELLITSDMGVDTALRVTANMAEGRMGRKLSTQEIKALLAAEIARIMEPVAKPMPIYPKRPQVVLVVGVNGSGKTTTIGKLASQFKAAGKSVVIAAGDTFRAAAVEQLQIWGERAGVPVLTAPEGSDPASLAFDAMDRAERD